MTPPLKPDFILRAITNNADPQLAGSIDAADTTIALQTGDGAKLPQPRSGAATSTGDAQNLTDTGDLSVFAVGDYIENVTDGSFAIVLDISGAPNSIKTTPLYGGSDNTWTSGDTWAKDRAVLTFAHLVDGEIDTSERVLMTARSTDTITVERGWDGDTAIAFDVGDYAYLMVEKSAMLEMQKAIVHMYMRIHESYLNTDRYAEPTSASNDFEITLTPAITDLDDIIGMPINIKSDFDVTGACTLAVNGLTAKAIKKNQGTTDIASGNIANGQIFQVIYDGTNFQMQTFVPNTETLITLEDIGRFGDGSDGTPTWTSGATLDPDTVYNYDTATLPVSQSIITDEDNKVLRIRVLGDLTINGKLDLKGRGGAKGAKGTKATGSGTNNATSGGDGTAGKDAAGQSIAGGGTGGGRGTSTSGQGQAAGGGSGASIKGNGSAGEQAGSWTTGTGAAGTLDDLLMRILSNMGEFVCCGGGGGGGGGSGWPSANNQGGDGSDGGDGGGAAIIYVGGNLTLGASSTIDCRGDNGADGTSYGSGNPSGMGAGGGGGSVVIIVNGSITNSGVTLQSSGGTEGSESGNPSNGGTGKDGRIIIYSLKDGNYILG